MILWISLTLLHAKDCPTSDLYAHKLDAYTIEVEDEHIQFRLVVDEETVIVPDVDPWTSMLRSCGADETLAKFEQWQESWGVLSDLGVAYQTARWRKKWLLSKDIRNLERDTAIQYAQMLQRLELETGISVLWNVDGHPLAKGMVSAGRGSPKVYQYIYYQYNYIPYSK